MDKEALHRILDSLDDATFKNLSDLAVATSQYKTEVHALNLATVLVLLGAASYIAYYIPGVHPTLVHRAFLFAMVAGALPLALLKLRDFVLPWMFDRALARQAVTSGLIK
ncbi:hypothetical protein MQC88_00465 [Luteimonas sp. 50]|uniref:Uncharacterized protein n=1 Tax=Cognatiluteimonas sedimenti TaxID=2927791 RepID=A0ABT0A0D7_9GAMM|nr:hypothetical protein [Lysobacter sedimenti]MCJ0824444.1 hypothetical protein [Lysobacter sedimenti]